MRSQFWAAVKHTTFGTAGAIILSTVVVSPTPAQLPIPNLQLPPSSLLSDDSKDSKVVTT